MGCAATTRGRHAKLGDGKQDDGACASSSPQTVGGSSSSTSPPPADSEVPDLQQSDEPLGKPFVTSSGRVFQPRPLTDEERKIAWTGANFYRATAGNDKPVALWVVGPSSVGKSTLAVHAGDRFGIPTLDDKVSKADQSRGKELDAVIIDGEFMRDAHALWPEWVSSPDWRSAYPALKSTINAEKDALMHEAARQKRNMVIPQTCLKLSKSLADMEVLTRNGYENHVFAVVAPLADCQRRGSKREKETGKRYQPLEFEKSIEAIPPMIAKSQGRYEVVRAIERPDCLEMDYEVLDSGYWRQDAAQLEAQATLPGQPGEHESVPAEGQNEHRMSKIRDLIRHAVTELS